MIKENEKVKISVYVGEELVGNHYITPGIYPAYAKLVDAINENSIQTIVKMHNGDILYENGSVYNSQTGYFNENSEFKKYSITNNNVVFGFVSNNRLIATQDFESPLFDAYIAAYQSNPTFKAEIIAIDRW